MADVVELAELGGGPPGESYEKLRPGPGRPAPEVSSHQRTRLHNAMIEIASEHGYGAVTVRDLTRLANVSTRSFYQHFGEKESCFLSAYEGLVWRAARRMVKAQRAGRDWREQLRLGLQTLMLDLVAEPKAAQLVLVEAFAVGPAARERMPRAVSIFEAVAKASLNQAPERIVAPPFVVKAIVSGATRVARSRLLAGRMEELPGLVDELTEWALSYPCEVGEPGDWINRRDLHPLPPGIELEPEEEDGHGRVLGDARTLVLGAVGKLTASIGYATLSVPRIRAAAGVSRKSFDASFDGVAGCFLAAVELQSTSAITDAAQEGARAKSWPASVHRAVTALCKRIARDPQLASLAFVEILVPGPDGMRRRERLVELAAEGLRGSAPPGQRPSRLAAEASIGAAWDAIHDQVATGRAAQLPQQAAALTFLLLAPAVGSAKATEAIRAEQAA